MAKNLTGQIGQLANRRS